MRADSIFPVSCSLLLICVCWGPPASVQAQGPGWGPMRPFGLFDQQRQIQQRQLYRPNVHVVRAPGASRQLKAGSIQTVDYSVMRNRSQVVAAPNTFNIGLGWWF